MRELIDTFIAAVKRLVAYHRRQEDVAALCKMSEREMKDIGLNRYDINKIAT